MENLPFFCDPEIHHKNKLRYTPLNIPATINKGKFYRLGNIFGTPLILHRLKYSAYSIIVLAAYHILTHNTCHATQTTYILHTTLKLLFTVLHVSIAISDPGFVSRPASIDVEHVTCNRCLAVVTDNARHCRVAGICVRGYDHFCILLGNCFSDGNAARIYVLVGVFVSHLLLIVVCGLAQ